MTTSLLKFLSEHFPSMIQAVPEYRIMLLQTEKVKRDGSVDSWRNTGSDLSKIPKCIQESGVIWEGVNTEGPCLSHCGS